MALTHKAFGRRNVSYYDALQDTDAWHDLFEDLLYDNEDDGKAYFMTGDNADSESVNNPASQTEENTTATNAPIQHYGPMAVTQHWEVETVMYPEMVVGSGDAVRYSWGFQGPIPIGTRPGNMVTLIGAYRYHIIDSNSFDFTLDDQDKLGVIAELISGDYSLLQQRITADTSASANFMRHMLFGGDENTEQDRWNDSDVQVNIKGKAVISTPYRRVNF